MYTYYQSRLADVAGHFSVATIPGDWVPDRD